MEGVDCSVEICDFFEEGVIGCVEAAGYGCGEGSEGGEGCAV